MKKISIFFVTIVLSLQPTIVPALADDAATKDAPDQKAQQKSECMLVARNCGNSVISIQDKIERLKEEIARGRTVYTPEELNSLKQKLDDTSKTLDFLLEKK